jgi:hypothetical protein
VRARSNAFAAFRDEPYRFTTRRIQHLAVILLRAKFARDANDAIDASDSSDVSEVSDANGSLIGDSLRTEKTLRRIALD